MIFAGRAGEAAAAPVEGLAKSLQGVEVFDLSGKAVPVVDLWKDRKAIVAFARHFGCDCHSAVFSQLFVLLWTIE
jgi:meiotic recombination protein SPO11